MTAAPPALTALRPCPRCGVALGLVRQRDQYGPYDSCIFCGLTIEQDLVLPGEIISKRKGFELG